MGYGIPPSQMLHPQCYQKPTKTWTIIPTPWPATWECANNQVPWSWDTKKPQMEQSHHLRHKQGQQDSWLCTQNLKVGNKRAKETTYKALIRPKLEYVASVWDPHTEADTKTLEKVQSRAARWVTSRYWQTSCVNSILTDLDWPPLQNRRKKSRLELFYKFHKGLITINSSHLPTPSNNRLSSRKKKKKTLPAMTFLAAELDTGKCHFFYVPSLSGMLYQRRLRTPSRWTFSSPGSPLLSNSTNPSPHPHPLSPSQISQIPLVHPHNPHLIIPWFGQDEKWKCHTLLYYNRTIKRMMLAV